MKLTSANSSSQSERFVVLALRRPVRLIDRSRLDPALAVPGEDQGVA
jgi:hypothetical protein